MVIYLKNKYYFIIFLLLFSHISFSYDIPKNLTFVGGRKANDPRAKWLISIYEEAFSKLGIKIKFIEVPPIRAIELADNGEVDGDIARVYSYGNFHPTLIRVEELMTKVSFSAFTVDESIKLKGWESLKNNNYNIEYRLGVKVVQEGLKDIAKSENISLAKDIQAGINKLIKGRTNIYIDNRALVNHTLNNQLQNSNTKIYDAGVMQEVTIHLYLHEKHRDLIPYISRILGQMKKNGRYDYYKEKYMINIEW